MIEIAFLFRFKSDIDKNFLNLFSLGWVGLEVESSFGRGTCVAEGF
jgi:hypothetical protein